MNTIKTYILEKVTKIICGDDSIDNWDSYVEMLHTYGIDDVIARYSRRLSIAIRYANSKN